MSQSLETSKILQSELHHRVKNNLQIIISLLELNIDEIEDVNAKVRLENICQRIYSIASTHDALNGEHIDKKLKTRRFINSICDNFVNYSQVGDNIIINSSINELEDLSIDTMMPIGMILNELLNNSLKHFNNHHDKLIISINLIVKAEKIIIKYKDNGPGFPEGKLKQREGGIGTYLLSSMIRQLNGTWNSSNDNGAKTIIEMEKK